MRFLGEIKDQESTYMLPDAQCTHAHYCGRPTTSTCHCQGSRWRCLHDVVTMIYYRHIHAETSTREICSHILSLTHQLYIKCCMQGRHYVTYAQS